jgi:hypothetical protein
MFFGTKIGSVAIPPSCNLNRRWAAGYSKPGPRGIERTIQ